MSIQSNAFGRVLLTDSDARKFQAQATYGRPKKAAKSSAAQGIELSRELKRKGAIKFKLKPV